MPELIGILAGTPDDPDAFKPTVEIYHSRAQQWTQSADERRAVSKDAGVIHPNALNS